MDGLSWYIACALGYLAWVLREMHHDREYVFGSMLDGFPTLTPGLKVAYLVSIAAVLLAFIAIWPCWLAADVIAILRRRR